MVGVCVCRREREECGGGACALVSACCGYGPARPGGRLLFPGSKLLAVHWKSSRKSRGGRKNGSCGSLHTSAAWSLVPLQVCYLMGASFLPKLECFFGPATPVLAWE